jgi:gluconate 2-dehydrogenase gamma chain
MKRRIFLKVSGASALVPAASPALTPPAPTGAASSAGVAGNSPGGYLFFSAPEAAFIEAAVVRLIPPDDVGPSALQAGVPTYIDLQLHGAWGAGERLYRSGPWQAGSPTQGYQLPLTPAELFRTAIRAIGEDLQKNGGKPFDQLPGEQQDAYLTALQNGQKELGAIPSKVFFDSLLSMTIEGYFCDPVYGGNKDMAAWAMIGFPGAYGAYYDLVDHYGVTFNHPPRSLGERRDGHIMLDPNIPATAPTPHGAGAGAAKPAHGTHGKGHA